jgi:hypothetical protein
MHDDPAAPLLPTLPSLARAPIESKKLAAIVLAADVVRRDVWEEEVDLAPALFDRYPRDMPPTPDDFRAAGYQLVVSSQAAHRRACTNCFLSPGSVICARCFGLGRTDEGSVCQYCNGEKVVCAACDGAAETVRTTLRHVNDRPLAIRAAFFPALPKPIQGEIQRHIDGTRPPRESHRFALEANVVQSAYRGASALVAPEFHGHAFGDALDGALAAARELDRYANVVRRDVRAYAWPFLVLRFEADGWGAVVYDADSALHFIGEGGFSPATT